MTKLHRLLLVAIFIFGCKPVAESQPLEAPVRQTAAIPASVGTA
ncbi:MAG: hypothetical protein JWN02_530, partial [Acidobacteria bacterium]|nr:hypothetical protein [Acidobacteriota bacterium]